jgi:hypothetical protein
VEPKLNLSLKLSPPWLEACSDALTYCMLGTKPKRRVRRISACPFATTYVGAAVPEARER